MEQPDSPHALIVEDEVIILVDIGYIIEDAGFTPFEALSADSACDVLGENAAKISLLVSDIDLPGEMNGLQLAHHVAEHWPWIEIVLMSGRRRPEPAEMPAGVTFFEKPFSREMVLEHVQQHLARNRKPLSSGQS